MIALFAALVVCQPCTIEDVRVEVGDGTVLEKANVVVENGRISKVGNVPPVGERIDGRGKVLTPGFIESRTTLGILDVELESSTDERRVAAQPLAPGFEAWRGFSATSVWIPITRADGITTAIVAPQGGVLAGTGFAADLDGVFRIAPPAVAMFGSITEGPSREVGGSRGAAWLRLREAFADAKFYRQNKAAFEKGDARPLALSPLHLEALLPVIDGRLPLVLEASAARDIAAALQFAKDENVRIAIADGAEAWLVADRLASARVPVLLRPSTQEPASFDALASRDDLAAKLEQAGVTVVLTSGPGSDVRRLRQEAGIAVANGLSPAAAMKAVTLAPAQLYGLDAQLGTIAPGKRANVVLWSGDPFELGTRTERVFIDGREQDPRHRQRQLVERYR